MYEARLNELLPDIDSYMLIFTDGSNIGEAAVAATVQTFML